MKRTQNTTGESIKYIHDDNEIFILQEIAKACENSQRRPPERSRQPPTALISVDDLVSLPMMISLAIKSSSAVSTAESIPEEHFITKTFPRRAVPLANKAAPGPFNHSHRNRKPLCGDQISTS